MGDKKDVELALQAAYHALRGAYFVAVTYGGEVSEALRQAAVDLRTAGMPGWVIVEALLKMRDDGLITSSQAHGALEASTSL